MTLQVVSLFKRSSRKQHGTENNRSWLSTCSQVIRPWLLKIQHGKPCHTFAKLDVSFFFSAGSKSVLNLKNTLPFCSEHLNVFIYVENSVFFKH